MFLNRYVERAPKVYAAFMGFSAVIMLGVMQTHLLRTTQGNAKIALAAVTMGGGILFALIGVAFAELLVHEQIKREHQVAFVQFQLRFFQAAISLAPGNQATVDCAGFNEIELGQEQRELRAKTQNSAQTYEVFVDTHGTCCVKRLQ